VDTGAKPREQMERRVITIQSWLPWVLWLVASGGIGGLAHAQDDEVELAILLREEREEADRLRRSGELRGAERILSEHLEDDPEDYRSLLISAHLNFDRNRVARAVKQAKQAFELAEAALDGAAFAESTWALIEFTLELGDGASAAEIAERAGAALETTTDARSAWWLSQVRLAEGKREEARELWATGSRADAAGDWEELLAKARCERAAGWFERASRTITSADKAARASQGRGDADIHTELGSLFFEVYREVESATGNRHSVADEYREALRLNPIHEGALLGQLELYRYNWRRQRRSSGEILEDLLSLHGDSVDVQLAAASMALDSGQLPRAELHLARAEELAPKRREVRTERAALAWVRHLRDDAREILAELKREDPTDGRPNREVGRHLCALYRFAEAVPFLQESVAMSSADPEAWTQLGRALANTGDEEAALEALYKSKEVAGGRLDGWRKNMRLVLERIRDECVVSDYEDLSFVWRPDAMAVLEVYLPKFYAEAREDLAKRYGFTPTPTRIEVFREHQDFSTRSTGFEGFPATGVCFGPVVTALSPLSEMRGAFNWARTGFHEFSHVIHLGLSNNRCPRWITEGLATWEELERDSSWTRNMRRELLDSRANDQIIRVRDLNSAFRGPRILFGYYQGGLLCEMLIDQHGFGPMVRLLQAFDRGLDLDTAFDEVFGATPEEVDRDFMAFVDAKLSGLRLEPRWSPHKARALRLSLRQQRPERASEVAEWQSDWLSLAWASWQSHNRVDAEEALRVIKDLEPVPRVHFLRAEIALSLGKAKDAEQLIRKGIELGGEDFRSRMVLGVLALQGDDQDEALVQFRAAEAAFPGFSDPQLSAERSQWELHDSRKEKRLAMAARERWLAWNPSDLEQRLIVARWHSENERFEESAARYREMNDVDPFQRSLHREWGRALAKAGRHEEALREYDVALMVPAGLDADLNRFLQAPIHPKLIATAMVELASEENRALSDAERARKLDQLLGVAGAGVELRAEEYQEIVEWRAESLEALGRAESTQ